MSVQVATGELLLDKILENSNIKAVAIVDERGYVIESRGTAACFKFDGGRDTTSTTDRAASAPTENVYLVEAGEDFVIVVFDDRMNFERIKESVDAALGEFDMAPHVEE